MVLLEIAYGELLGVLAHASDFHPHGLLGVAYRHVVSLQWRTAVALGGSPFYHDRVGTDRPDFEWGSGRRWDGWKIYVLFILRELNFNERLDGENRSSISIIESEIQGDLKKYLWHS